MFLEIEVYSNKLTWKFIKHAHITLLSQLSKNLDNVIGPHRKVKEPADKAGCANL